LHAAALWPIRLGKDSRYLMARPNQALEGRDCEGGRSKKYYFHAGILIRGGREY